MSAFSMISRSTFRSSRALARPMSSSVARMEPSAQHPGKSDIDHLENPSASEEVVHAEKAPDPLKSGATKVGGSSSGQQQQGQSTTEKVKQTVESVVDKVKQATGTK